MDRASSNRLGQPDETNLRPSPAEMTHGSKIVELRGGSHRLLLCRPDAYTASTTAARLCPSPSAQDKKKLKCCKPLNFDFPYVDEKTGPLSSPGFSPNILTCTRQTVEDKVQSILGDPRLGLTPTSRVILLHLAHRPSGARIEEIAFSTGSKYRWVESQVSRLTQLSILRRVSPGTYAINIDREVQE
jgi:hypothetical protein